MSRRYIRDPDANVPSLISQPEDRLKRIRKLLEIYDECVAAGVEMSPISMYMEDPIFSTFVKRESEALQILEVERDIILALTFNRFRQNNPDKVETPSAELDYDSYEY